MNITLLGIGMMGLPMGQRLRAAGFAVTAWNRTAEKALRLASHGARMAHTAAQAVREADVVITMLENGDVVNSVLFGQGVAQVLKPGTLVIDMSSITPAQARDHARHLADFKVHHLDAPVSGGTVGAEAGTLAIMAGGDAEDFERALPILSALGRATFVGPHGAGQLAKLANQMIVGITIGAVSEALLLASKGGADLAKVREAIRGGFAESRVLEIHGQRMVERDFAKRAAMSVQLKDMANALDTADALDFHAPITKLFTQLYREAVDHGLGEYDHSALFAALAHRNGMK